MSSSELASSIFCLLAVLGSINGYAISTERPWMRHGTTNEPVQVRLVDGDTYYRGRVEVYYQGQWGTICDDEFDHNDVKVICRMLGLYRGSSYGVAYGSASFCPGRGSIMLDNLQCYGNEHDISQCGSNGWFIHNCGHHEDAGVDCYEYNYNDYGGHTTVQTSLCKTITTNDYNYQTTDNQVQVRLVGGDYYYGRVEVYYQGQWSTICDDNFDHNDVKVICRMLGQYWGSDYGVAYNSATYGSGSGPIIIDELGCYGYESDITQCTSNQWYTNDCTHSEDASLNCHAYNYETTTYSPNVPWYDRITKDYRQTSEMPVQVRLVGGSYYYGRVEVYYQGQWGTICDDDFDHNDVKVICRMLGLYQGSDYGVAYQSARYGSGSGPIIIDDLRCSGYESDITQCTSNPWYTNNCGHGEDASLNCYVYNYQVTTYSPIIPWFDRTTQDYQQTSEMPVQVRLVGGDYYYGRVEVYYQGRWGTICDDDFDHNDVKVICRMLGQYWGSDYGVAYQSARYGSGSGPIIIDDLRCYGYESDITQCNSSPWNTNNCNHDEDASLDCHAYNYEITSYRPTTPWYHRTTHGLTIQSAILVTCDENGWDIRVDMYKLRLLYPGAKASDIYLGENNCHGTESWKTLRFNHGLRDCLTQELMRNNQLVYSNQLVYAEHDPLHPFIIRNYNWTIGVECDVEANENSTGHLHLNYHQVTHHQVTGESHFSVNMMFYSDPNFQYKLQYPLSVTVGENVYVKVYTNATDWNIRMRVHTCYTKPSQDASDNLKIYLIRNGCEIDTDTHIISQISHETRFVFQGFEYTNNHDDLYVSCDAKFCTSNDYSRECMQTCNPIIRRNVVYRPGDPELDDAVPGEHINSNDATKEPTMDTDVTENPTN